MTLNINKEITDMKAALASLEAKAAKPTYTHIVFSSTAELAQALLDGRKFLTNKDATLSFDETVSPSPFRYKSKESAKCETMDGIWDQFANLWEINTAVVPWYLNIPDRGISCYVSDHQSNPDPVTGSVTTIYRFNGPHKYPFRGRAVGWRYATPVT